MASALLNNRRGLSMDSEVENFRLLTLPEAAQMLHVSTRTLQRMMKKSDLPAFKVGGQWRVRESQLSQWIRSREQSSDKTDQD
jgi:excisionase family DNA binding protein